LPEVPVLAQQYARTNSLQNLVYKPLELRNAQNRIRKLIGKAHWLTDGEHKESILRRVLRNHVPESIRVGRGFVLTSNRTSNQLDILLTYKNKPTLFKDEELTIVTSDAVEAIGEVKTKLTWKRLQETLAKAADNVARIRHDNQDRNQKVWCGLFVYESMPSDNSARILKAIQESSRGELHRVVDLVVLGPNMAVQFVEKETSRSKVMSGSGWISYHLQNLAQAFFLSNVVLSVARDSPRSARAAWLPLKKRDYRKSFITLDGHFGDFPPEERRPRLTRT